MMPERFQPEQKKITVLQNFISQGVGILRDQKYYAAMQYFFNVSVAKSVGIHFEDTPRALMVRKPIISEDQMQKLVHTIALHSHFDYGIKGTETVPFMSLTIFMIPEEVKQISNQVFVGRAYHNIGLVYAEAWIHALQHRVGPLAGSENKNIDVALYLKKQGVELTEEFLARHNRKPFITG